MAIQGESVSRSSRPAHADQRPESDDCKGVVEPAPPELVEMFEKYVYGRVPIHVPTVTWTVTAVDRETIRFHPVIAKDVIAQVGKGGATPPPQLRQSRGKPDHRRVLLDWPTGS